MSNHKNTLYTCKASREVQYSFTCENCGRDSGYLSGTFHGEVSRSIRFRDRLTDEQLASLCESAQQDLSKEIEATQTKDYYLFDDKCQHCYLTQSWGEQKRKLNGLGRLAGSLIIINFIAFTIFVNNAGFLKNIPLVNRYAGFLFIIGLFVVVFLPVLILSPIKQKIIKQKKISSKPTVYWDTIKDTEFSITITDTDFWGAVKKCKIDTPEAVKGVHECKSTEV